MDLVTIENGELKLNSLMDELSFGKTNYDSIVTEKGLLAKGKLNCNSQIFTALAFSDWTFSDIQALDVDYQDKRSVFYCGKVPFFNSAENSSTKVKSLNEIYLKGEKAKALKEEKTELFNCPSYTSRSNRCCNSIKRGWRNFYSGRRKIRNY